MIKNERLKTMQALCFVVFFLVILQKLFINLTDGMINQV